MSENKINVAKNKALSLLARSKVIIKVESIYIYLHKYLDKLV